jgi:hypothetical protein
MTFHLRNLFKVAVACGVVASAPAMADEAALQAQITLLTKRIEQMEAAQRTGAVPLQASSAASSPKAIAGVAPESPPISDAPSNSGHRVVATEDAEPVTKGTLPGSFKIPGTNTSVKIGGFARLDMIKDLQGGESGTVALPATIPLSGSPQSQRRGALSLTARQTRVYLRALTPTALGDATTFLEGDFYGAGGNETVTNSVAFRLRQAYAEIGSWLAGQTWMNVNDVLSLPETLDFSGGNGIVQEGRQAQIRYTQRFSANQQLSLSVENPESDVVGTTQTTIGAATGPTSATTLDKVPDLSVRYVYSGDWGRMSFSAMARRITFDNTGGAAVNGFVGQSSVNAGSWALQGRIKTFGSDNFQYSFAEGPGVGRYILGVSNNTGAVVVNDKLEAIRQRAFMTGYQHFWTPTWRSNLIYGLIDASYPHPAVPLSTPSRISALFANVIWNPIPNGFIGMEWSHASARNDAADTPTLSNEGMNNRLAFSAQYGF